MNSENSVLSLTEADSGKSIVVKPGVFITVKLVTSEDRIGYHWVDDSPCLDAKSASNFLLSEFRIIDQYFESGMSVLSYAQSFMGAGKIKINLVAPDGSVVDRIGFGFMALH